MPTMPMRFGDSGLGDGSPYQSVDWDDRKVRHAFIRKVYAIISLQLLVTVGIISVFTFVDPVRSFVKRNVAIYYASYAVFLVTYLVLACCQGPRRRFPWNIILLSIFTLAMGLMTGTIASMYDTKAVLIAMLITAIVAIVVTIFCFQTKVDFTSCPGLFCVLGIVVMVTGIITAIVLSFKYVSGEDRGAVGCPGYFWLGIPRAGAGRGFGGSRVWYQPWKAACLQGESVPHQQQLLKSRVRAGPACLACCLPAPRLTLLVFPSRTGALAPHAVRSHRGHRVHAGELTAAAGRGWGRDWGGRNSPLVFA
uniref:Transmembrane BAX inhibitor motif containing 1 n=1 Tax=Ficedula albicollis TaxID=59894 RepID=A0A803WC02_FICAL